MSFPLYSILEKNNSDYEDTKENQLRLIERINNMTDEQHKLIYVIIKMFYIRQKPKTNLLSLPFGGKMIDKNIEFQFNTFPLKLKKMIHEFSKLQK